MKDLATRVEERQRLLEALVDHANKLLTKYGKTLSYTMHSCHITQTRELKNFSGFTVWDHGAYTMFGGETTKIYWGEQLVFEVEFWEIKKATIKTFVEDGWEKKFLRLKAEKIAAQIKATESKELTARIAEAYRQDRQRKVETEAARLNLV
jgi:hypothetical protein